MKKTAELNPTILCRFITKSDPLSRSVILIHCCSKNIDQRRFKDTRSTAAPSSTHILYQTRQLNILLVSFLPVLSVHPSHILPSVNVKSKLPWSDPRLQRGGSIRRQ